MSKENESLKSLSYDEKGALQIHHQINDAYSSGVIDGEDDEADFSESDLHLE